MAGMHRLGHSLEGGGAWPDLDDHTQRLAARLGYYGLLFWGSAVTLDFPAHIHGLSLNLEHISESLRRPHYRR